MIYYKGHAKTKSDPLWIKILFLSIIAFTVFILYNSNKLDKQFAKNCKQAGGEPINLHSRSKNLCLKKGMVLKNVHNYNKNH